MLVQLTVNNLAIADALELHFQKGMTVITGETGAGKSIILDALGLTLGDRTDAGLVRFGKDKTDITARFDTTHLPEAQAWLTENDLEGDANECLLRRVITKEGRSRAYINGQPCPLGSLKTLGEMLIEIHGQHEHQTLLKKDTHRRLLDNFSGCEQLAEQTSQHYQQWKKASQRLKSLQENQAEQDAKLQLLRYQVQELEQLDLQPEELNQLEAEQAELSHAETLLTQSHQALTLCSDGDTTANDILGQALYLMESLPVEHPALLEARQLLQEAQIQLQEASHSIRRFTDSFELDPERLQEVEERLSAIYQLARKHRINADAIPALYDDLSQQLSRFEDGDDNIDTLMLEVEKAAQHYQECSARLSQERIKGAQQLDERIAEQLAALGMPSMQFITQLTSFEDENFSLHGMEDIEFLISPNPGQPAKPLAKIASGGELSRISLAIQVVTAQTSVTPTLVFDEVDVGIGGATADIVGKLLRQLGTQGQVLCVTHLPQVSAQGHQHLYVSKRIDNGETFSSIKPLNGEHRVQEIARMLGGINITDQSIAHAREMLSL